MGARCKYISRSSSRAVTRTRPGRGLVSTLTIVRSPFLHKIYMRWSSALGPVIFFIFTFIFIFLHIDILYSTIRVVVYIASGTRRLRLATAAFLPPSFFNAARDFDGVPPSNVLSACCLWARVFDGTGLESVQYDATFFFLLILYRIIKVVL